MGDRRYCSDPMTGYSDLWGSDGARPFITDESRTYTYAEVNALVKARADRLDASSEHVVAVAPDNTVASVVECLAAWESGGVLQLINRRLTPGEVARQLRQTGASVLVEDDSIPVKDSSDAGPASFRRGGVAVIVSTSGSSGAPKFVELTWENLLASAEASRHHLHHSEQDRWLAVLPLFHVGGFSIVLRSMLVGSEVVLRRSFDPAQTAADLRTVTLASLVGSMLPLILEADPGPYTGLRAVLVGGGPTPQAVLAAAASAGIPVLSTYGMTETASQIATSPLGDGPHRRAKPLPGAEVRISDTGEIEVRGPMVSLSTVGGPVRAAGEWFATGDLGSIDDEGFVRVDGRRSDLIISGGENIMPAEVEAVLERLEGVREVAVFGVPDARWGEQVGAAVVADVPASQVEADACRHLAGYKIPKRWLELSELPRNSLGKVDRLALRSMAEDDCGR